jgi:ubiquinone/menaquinone biosynthesis C-methylase UbiE
MANQWKTIWDRKGEQARASGAASLEDLIRADGFDSGAGDHSIESWNRFTAQVYQRLQIGAGKNILEVGCGSGAFLLPAYRQGVHVTGVDYCEALVATARGAMPGGKFLHGEASALPVESGQYDIVLSHSVFQYFESDDYAGRCIDEMLRSARSNTSQLAILDVNDADKQSEFHRIREAGIGAREYARKYQDFPHRFYHKSWFTERLKNAGWVSEIVDQQIDGYANSAFRFNVFAWSL